MDRLIEEKIYEPKSIFNIRALLNAFIIHSSFNRKISLKDFFRYLNFYNTKSQIHLIILKLLLSLYWLRVRLLPPQRLTALIILSVMLLGCIILTYIDVKVANYIGIFGFFPSTIGLLIELFRNK